jgi:hypothetical protein
MMQSAELHRLYYGTKETQYGREGLAIAIFLLQSGEVGLALGKALFDEIPAEDKSRPKRQEGLRQMYSGMAGTISGCLKSLSLSVYTQEDREEFADGLVSAVPSLWKRLDKDSQDKLLTELSKLAESHPNARIRQSLGKLKEAVAK